MLIFETALKERFTRVMLTLSRRMHAGAETDPSDTINEIIFSTRKVRLLHYSDMCTMHISRTSLKAACHLSVIHNAHALAARQNMVIMLLNHMSMQSCQSLTRHAKWLIMRLLKSHVINGNVRRPQ